MRALTLRGRLRTAVGTVLLAMAGALGLAQDAAAQRELRVEDFSVTLTVHEDGTMDVLESIRYGFTGSWNGVFRDIPISYQSPSGLNFRLVLDDISVRNEAGETLRFETSRERHYRRIKVWVPGAQNTSRTVDFRYTVKNPLRFFDGEGEGFSGGYDELYWNATGDESEISIDQASVTVHLPAALTGVQARAYTGSYGSTASDATITEIQDGFYVQSLRGFAPREGLTVDLAWNPGVIRRPTIVDRTASTFRANWVLLLPILSFFLMWKHWKAKGKDPDRRAVAPQYKPPEGMTPAEIGTLVDNRPDMKDITASIVDLAVRGYIRIERREDKGLFGLTSSEEYTFHRVKKSESRDLPGFEKKLLGELFRRGTGDRVKTEDLESDFYSEIKDLKERIFTQLIEAGYYKKRPDHVVARYMLLGIVALGLGIFFALAFADALGVPPSSLSIGIVGAALPILILGPLMSRRTKAGTRQLEHILGFQEFLSRVEADHFKRMIDSPQMFERYLPHAMALGVESRWARAFEDIYTEPPSWYVGDGPAHFNSVGLSRSMTSMSNRTGSVMTSQPRSSGGSGFGGGGGGFSGGGFGGGGTGGF